MDAATYPVDKYCFKINNKVSLLMTLNKWVLVRQASPLSTSSTFSLIDFFVDRHSKKKKKKKKKKKLLFRKKPKVYHLKIFRKKVKMVVQIYFTTSKQFRVNFI